MIFDEVVQICELANTTYSLFRIISHSQHGWMQIIHALERSRTATFQPWNYTKPTV